MKKNLNIFSFVLLGLSLIINSCTTEDIDPAILLSSNSPTLSIDVPQVEVNATLNSVADKNVSIDLSLSGTADYRKCYFKLYHREFFRYLSHLKHWSCHCSKCT